MIQYYLFFCGESINAPEFYKGHIVSFSETKIEVDNNYGANLSDAAHAF